MQPLSRAKRGAFLAVMSLFLWAVVELLSGAALWLRDGEAPLPARLRTMRRVVLVSRPPVAAGLGAKAKVSADSRFPQEALHPYLGFVLDPETASGRTVVTAQGFFEVLNRKELKSEGPFFEVGIFGGSVATGFCFGARLVFAERVERSGLNAGRPVRIRCFALGGYKQPQQLMALQWLLAEGQRFDLVLNIDGFNEVALPAGENILQGVHPFYPRSWRLHSNSQMSPETLRRLGEIEFLNAERRRKVHHCGRAPLSWSPFCHLLWSVGDRRLAQRLVELEGAPDESAREAKSFSRRGPRFGRLRPAELYPELARLWAESSLLMHQTLKARGVPYFHFLQPNQYVEGSKPMGADELRLAVLPKHPYRGHVERGYPQLLAAGRKLAEAGVQFHDLTRLFADHPEPLYEDSCCHYNQRGNDLLGVAVGEIVIRARSSAAATSP